MLFKVENEAYLDWLVRKIANYDPDATADFRNRSYTKNTIKEEWTGKGSGEVFIGLYKWILQYGSWDEGLKELIKLYPPEYGPLLDGKTHINIYTKGKTWLGMALSNLAPIGLDHPVDGKFATLEGYWYYLSTGKKFEDLRILDGFEAKKKYKKEPRTPVADFEEQIKIAITCKIDQHPELRREFIKSTLPFTHYYFFGNEYNAKIVKTEGFEWMIDHFETLRDHLRKYP